MDQAVFSRINPSYLSHALIFILTLFFFGRSPQGTLRLTYDSYDYIAASENLQTYLYGKTPDGFSYLVRAPLFPAYLSLFENKVMAGWWLNALSFIFSLILILKTAQSLGLSPVFQSGIVILTAFSYPWLQNHFFLWTESLFCALIFLLVYALIQNKGIGWIVLLCLLLFALRKAGLFLGVGVCSFFLLRKEFRNFLILGFAFFLPAVGWELVTLHFAHRSTTYDVFSYQVLLSRYDYADALTAWWISRNIPLSIRVIICFGAVAALVVAFSEHLKIFFRDRQNQVLGVLAGVYLFIVIAFYGSPEYIEAERYISVILPLILMLVFSFCIKTAAALDGKKRMIYIGMLIWMIYPVARTLYHIL